MCTVKRINELKIGDRESKNKIRYGHDKTFPNPNKCLYVKKIYYCEDIYEMLVNIYKMHYNNTN